MTTLLLVQHGAKERGPGDPGLTRLGREQARQTAMAVASSSRPAAVYSSPLRRAAETASVIAAQFGLDVRCDARLRERMNWEGPATQPFESFLADWERTTRDRDFTPPFGDSSRSAGDRMLGAIDDIAGRHPGQTVVVTHGGATVDLLRTLLGDARLGEEAPGLLADGVPCCALTTLRRHGTGWQVDAIASDSHLVPL